MEDVSNPETILQLGVAPQRIDILSSLSAIKDFEHAWGRRARGRYGSVATQYLSLDDLIRKKEATGRLQDLADAEVLKRARARRS